jgi:hypothetical protein
MMLEDFCSSSASDFGGSVGGTVVNNNNLRRLNEFQELVKKSG